MPQRANRHWSWSKPTSEAAIPTGLIRYRLNVRAEQLVPGAEVWILLSQHITNKDRSLDDITLMVQDEQNPKGASAMLGEHLGETVSIIRRPRTR